jgi:hypothetical protein
LVYFAQFNLHVIKGKKKGGNPGVDTLSNTWGVTSRTPLVVFLPRYLGALIDSTSSTYMRHHLSV